MNEIKLPLMTAAQEFFYLHAGSAHNPAIETAEEGRRRGARELAYAEFVALQLGWWTETETDPDVMDDDADSVGLVESGEMVNLTLTLYRPPRDGDDGDDGDREPVALAALSGIVVPSETDPYLRVVAAQLAAEAIGGQA